jgi:parallel beta-helix repeat protein
MPKLHKLTLCFVCVGFVVLLSACSAEPSPTPAASIVVDTTPTRTRIPSRTPTQGSVTAAPTGNVTVLPTTISTAAPTHTPTPAPTSTSLLVPTPSVTPTMMGTCSHIWQSGYYILAKDVRTSDVNRYDCMIVQASDVVIDCNGHSIEGIDYGGYGFWIRKYGFPLLQTPTNVEIRNCKVSHARTGLFAEAGVNLYIHDNDFSNNFDDTDKRRYGIFLGLVEGGGIRLDNAQGARIENNVTNNGAIGIDIRDSDRVVVRNNTAVNNSAWGVSLLNTQNSEVSNNTLRDNVRYCTWGDGTVGAGCDAAAIILQDGASRNVVKNNTISGQNANGVFIKAHGTRCGDENTIQNNKITDAMYNGIEFSFCKGNKVIGNEVTGSYDAVWFGFSVSTEVRENVIRNMTNHGIISYNSRDSIVKDNQVINAREGIFFYWDDAYTRDPKRFYFLPPSPDQYASRSNLIEGNTLRDNSVAGIHLLNAIQNRIVNNTFTQNGKTIWQEGKSDGNVVENNR